jgi:hypothetical protein
MTYTTTDLIDNNADIAALEDAIDEASELGISRRTPKVQTILNHYSKGDYDFEVIGNHVATYLVCKTNERFLHKVMSVKAARTFWKSL